MSKITYINIDNHKELLSKGISLLYFSADWCGPCRMLAPIIDELAEKFEGKANIIKVNTDEQNELGLTYNVRSIPTILFFKDGVLKDTVIGAKSEVKLSNIITGLLA